MPGAPFVLLKLGGKEREFRIDMKTLSTAKAVLGSSWPGMKAFFRRLDDDPDFVAALYYAAFKRSDPALTLEQVYEFLKPGVELNSLSKQIADHFAYVMQGGAAEGQEGNPPGETATATEKSTSPPPSEKPEKPA